MPMASGDPLQFEVLFDSSSLSIREYRCRHHRSGPAAEEHSSGNDIVLIRHGVFCQHFGSRCVTADLNQAVFFTRNSTYRVSHPADCGDQGTVFSPSGEVLADIVREFDPSIDDRPDHPFPVTTHSCDAKTFLRHHALLHVLQTQEFDPLQAEAAALDLLGAILRAAYSQHGRALRPRRAVTRADHADRVEAAKAHLAIRFRDRVTLDNVARAAHCSPFHFSRMFHRQTGIPVHRYLTRLRLRAALDRLAQAPGDLTTLALEMGFSSHSHFGDCFRREFGCTPSDARRMGRRDLGEMSRNLRV